MPPYRCIDICTGKAGPQVCFRLRTDLFR
ncbi:MAG: hypothetical protein QOJ68_2568, partial [Blastococcus sp.]|nr:hypothetical protein [Blastococcus sp.]